MDNRLPAWMGSNTPSPPITALPPRRRTVNRARACRAVKLCGGRRSGMSRWLYFHSFLFPVPHVLHTSLLLTLTLFSISYSCAPLRQPCSWMNRSVFFYRLLFISSYCFLTSFRSITHTISFHFKNNSYWHATALPTSLRTASYLRCYMGAWHKAMNQALDEKVNGSCLASK